MKDAISREYVYNFTTELIPCYLKNYVTVINFNINIYEFQQLLNFIVGTHDFFPFHCTGSTFNSSIKTI